MHWLPSVALLFLMFWPPLKWLAPLGWLLFIWESGLAAFWLLVLLGGNGPDIALDPSVFVLALGVLPLGALLFGAPRWWRFQGQEAFWKSSGVGVLAVHLVVWSYGETLVTTLHSWTLPVHILILSGLLFVVAWRWR